MARFTGPHEGGGTDAPSRHRDSDPLTLPTALAGAADELALFAAAGFLLFSLDDLLLDFLYFARGLWRAGEWRDARDLPKAAAPGWMAVFIPAWDEAAVIGRMLHATLQRIDYPNYTLLVGHYRNDPATAEAVQAVAREDGRVVPVEVPADGPTTKADCLNHLYAALVRLEADMGERAKAVVLHDAEDLVHPLELRLFDAAIPGAGLVQLPVVPLPDPASPWIAGHYCDEFAESHGKDLAVRQSVGAAIPLAGVGCAIRRDALAKLATAGNGNPFATGSMTEDYECGLRLGAMGERTRFIRLPGVEGERALVASRGHFPGTLRAAVRQKARWIGGISFAGWERLGWGRGWGENWFRMRDRKGPIAALLMLTGYAAAILWGQLWLGAALGAPTPPPLSPLLQNLLAANAGLLVWRLAMRAAFTWAVYGWGEALASLPRVLASNLVAILATHRALGIHLRGGPKRWDKTAHTFPTEYA